MTIRPPLISGRTLTIMPNNVSIFERIGLFIWKMRHHDEIIQQLETELDEAEDEIQRLKNEVERLRSES